MKFNGQKSITLIFIFLCSPEREYIFADLSVCLFVHPSLFSCPGHNSETMRYQQETLKVDRSYWVQVQGRSQALLKYIFEMLLIVQKQSLWRYLCCFRTEICVYFRRSWTSRSADTSQIRSWWLSQLAARLSGSNDLAL